MALSTFSKFWYGFIVDESNYLLNFSDAGGSYTVQIPFGGYTATTLGQTVQTLMTNVGDQDYSVSLDRSTRRNTIFAGSDFTLAISSGGTNQVYTLLGFTGPDVGGGASFLGDTETGEEFTPQFLLQDYVPTTNNQRPVDETLNETVDGNFELVSFGTVNIMECNIRYINNRLLSIPNKLEPSATGVEDANAFMQYVITKQPVEFMENRDIPGQFETLTLESTRQSQVGTQYQLQERFAEGLPDFYDTGVIRFRKQVL